MNQLLDVLVFKKFKINRNIIEMKLVLH